MENEKSNNQIISLGNKPNKLTIQKSRPLQELSQTDLSLFALKIIDIYLARINSHEPCRKTVIFNKDELERILEIKQIKHQTLDATLEQLMTPIAIPIGSKNQYAEITLFEKATQKMNIYGLYEITLECSQPAMEYIFNVDKIGYVKYALKDVLKLRSNYSYALYIYLEKNRNMHLTWSVDLGELKKILKCDVQETYKEFKRFNDRILKRVETEIKENTECHFKYELIKCGRFVTRIKFILDSKSVIHTQNAAIDFNDFNNLEKIIGDKSEKAFDENSYSEKAKQNGDCDCIETSFAEYINSNSNKEETIFDIICKRVGYSCDARAAGLESLESLIERVPSDKLPSDFTPKDITSRKIEYVKRKIDLMDAYDRENSINKRYEYLWKMIFKDVNS